jgi:type IV pilus assembly protein PilC
MSILLKASLSLKDAVEICASGSQRPQLRRLAEKLRDGMERGRSFLEALSSCARLPPVYSGLVRVGEKTGELSKAYERLAHYLAERKRLADSLSGAMLYPILILLVTVMGGGAVCLYALPKLRSIFMELGGAAAAGLERSLDAGAGAALWAMASCAAVALAAGLAFILRRQNPWFAMRLDKAAYHLPFFGTSVQSRRLLDFCFAMESMVSGGVPIDEALREASLASTNAYFSASLLSLRDLARSGRPLSQACRSLPAFPSQMAQWIGVGERTGKPQEIFGRLREYYQAIAERRAKAAMALIEPAASLLIGACVLFMLFSFVIPLFKAMGSMVSLQ